jgi:integrase
VLRIPPVEGGSAQERNRNSEPRGETPTMSADTVPLDGEQRLQVVAEFSDYPPSEQLLARLVILDRVRLHHALDARVGDIDLAAGRLTLPVKRGKPRVLTLDTDAVELAERATVGRLATEPLFVGHHGRSLHPDRFRQSILAAARRAGVPATLTVMRPGALIHA